MSRHPAPKEAQICKSLFCVWPLPATAAANLFSVMKTQYSPLACMTKDKFHFFSIIAEVLYTVETFSFVITVPVLMMTRPPGEVTHHVWGEVWVWRSDWRILMHWPFLREAPLPPLSLGNTRRWQCCRAPFDEMPFDEQKICFPRQGLWACESFSCRGVWHAWSARRQPHHRPLQPASRVLGAAAIRLLWMLLGPSCACCWLRRTCQLAEPCRAPWPEGYSLPGQGCASCNCSATLSHVILFSAY